MIFHFRLFTGKTNDQIFQNIQKTPFWAHFGAQQSFPKNSVRTSFFNSDKVSFFQTLKNN